MKTKQSTFKRLVFSTAIAGGMMMSPVMSHSSWAQEEEKPGELARESIELMMKSLGLIIDAIPQYEMPIITENGDIIIRRKQKDDWEDQDDSPENTDDEEATET